MPDPPQQPQPPVRFDADLAARATSAARSVVDALQEGKSQRATLAAGALENWRGRFADEFASALERAKVDARNLAEQLQILIERLEGAARAAADEQRLRDQYNEQLGGAPPLGPRRF